MFASVLENIQEKIIRQQYVMTIHAYSTDGNLVEVIVKIGLSGKVIIITVYAL